MEFRWFSQTVERGLDNAMEFTTLVKQAVEALTERGWTLEQSQEDARYLALNRLFAKVKFLVNAYEQHQWEPKVRYSSIHYRTVKDLIR